MVSVPLFSSKFQYRFSPQIPLTLVEANTELGNMPRNKQSKSTSVIIRRFIIPSYLKNCEKAEKTN